MDYLLDKKEKQQKNHTFNQKQKYIRLKRLNRDIELFINILDDCIKTIFSKKKPFNEELFSNKKTKFIKIRNHFQKIYFKLK